MMSVVCSHCGSVHAFPKWCGSRTCNVCNSHRWRKYARAIERYVMSRISKGDGAHAIFLTLTLRSWGAVGMDARTSMQRIKKAFRRLRRTKIFRSVEGGVMRVEKAGAWHCHIILFSTTYFDLKALSKAWRGETGDSHVVWATALRDAHQAAEYVAKYMTEASEELPPRERMIVWFGDRKIVVAWYIPPACIECGWRGWVVEWDSLFFDVLANGKHGLR